MPILGPKNRQKLGFSPPQTCQGARMNIPIGDKLFQDIPRRRRSAKFRANRPWDVESSVDGI